MWVHQNKEEVEGMGINVGTVVTFKDELMELGKNYYSGRALDNELVVHDLQKLQNVEEIKELPYKLAS
jgi:putative aminopeptidase FrvX